MTNSKDSTVFMDHGLQTGSKVQSPTEIPRSMQRKLGIAEPAPFRWHVRALFLFQILTQIYVTLRYLLPFALQDTSPLVLYIFQVFACYLCTMILAQWLSLICYSSVYKPTRDRPHVDLSEFTHNPPERFVGSISQLLQQVSSRHAGNGHVVVDVTEKGGLPWRYCKRCQMDVPPRAHHCPMCDVCILRRDHHCHLVGSCVGHWNQRYFVVLAAYAMVIGYLGGGLTLFYLWSHHHADQTSLWDYFLPVSIVKLLIGRMSGFQTLLVFHAHMLCFFGPMTNIYFFGQMGIIAVGKTKREVVKKVNLKVTTSVQDNLRLVFGDYWMVSFIIPAQLIFKQESDGTRYDGVKMVQDLPDDVRKLSD